jgi:hypothetical protein
MISLSLRQQVAVCAVLIGIHLALFLLAPN